MSEFESYPAGPGAYDEAASIQMVREGSAEAFTDIYNQYHDAVRGSLLYHAQGQLDEMTLEDILQDTFTKAFIKMNTYENMDKSLRPWLNTIAYNNLMDHFRKQALRKRIEGGKMPDDFGIENLPHDTAINTLASKAIVAYLIEHDITSEERLHAIIALKVEEQHGQEYSDGLGVPRGTTGSRIHRGISDITERFSKPSELLDAVFPDA